MNKLAIAFAFAASFFGNLLILKQFASGALSDDSPVVILAYVFSWGVTLILVGAFVLG